ncbi:phage tail assembly protein [Rhizobium miluonense]|uniref:Phage tail assembly chaperone protein, E, or 41 or 14 n=1 Tax=Rhizobium miluonense TaxID=411945 RepID=A0A1C3WNV3_9HYPH|nr:phage tail assembly protein [Rhizobium miluonense]SCB41772.1 Phage tail assembly chaperone protein, E, or 41 or 14 [Rhizobium miluonense]
MAAWEDGKFKFHFDYEIEAHGEKVKEFVLREPNGADVISVGNPVQFDPISDPPRVLVDDKRMAAMISRLADVPPSSVAKLKPKDLISLGWHLTPFFMPV